MSLLSFCSVLIAALLHASWNALIKLSGDRLAIMAVITGSTALLVTPLLFILPIPDRASWPYLAASAFIHAGYMPTLIKAYQFGDFSQVYPIARGSAPLLTTLLAAVLLKETPSGSEMIGILLLVTGIVALALEQNQNQRNKFSLLGICLSLLVGVFITSYSLIDGIGARCAGNALAFAAWTFFFDGFIVTGIAIVLRAKQLKQTVKHVWKAGIAAAIISTIAYSIVIWSFTQSPIGLVAALRETSVLFAMLISAVLIREKLSAYRVLMSTVIVLGAGLIGFDSLW